MNKRTIVTICLMALMAVLIFQQACQEAPPNFEVMSLDIMPPKVIIDEKATIEVEIRNSDAKMDTYNVPLMVNGVADDRKSVTARSRSHRVNNIHSCQKSGWNL